MKINKIKKMKDNKYKIMLDDFEIITYDNVILENDLLYKKNIDSSIYNKIVDDTKYYDSYNKVLKYISKKRRSSYDIYNYLKKLNLKDKDVESIISKLKSINLINDIEYVRAYINDKVRLSKNGINKIKSDLIGEHIDLDIINNELLNIDNELLTSKLEKIVLKKIKSNTKYSNNYIKNKILNEMINLGYNKSDIINILEKNINDDSDILKTELDKLYDKLSKKYNGVELENKVRQKLMIKGFSIGDINTLLYEKKKF